MNVFELFLAIRWWGANNCDDGDEFHFELKTQIKYSFESSYASKIPG